MGFIGIGHGNLVNADRLVAIVGPEAAPVKRLVSEAKKEGRLIDATGGRKTRAVLLADSDHVVLSALAPETVAARLGAKGEQDES